MKSDYLPCQPVAPSRRFDGNGRFPFSHLFTQKSHPPPKHNDDEPQQADACAYPADGGGNGSMKIVGGEHGWGGVLKGDACKQDIIHKPDKDDHDA